jgi:hypothetical protein
MRRRGQSVLEYVIMLTATIAAIVLWQSATQPGNGTGVDKMVSKSADKISSSSKTLLDTMFP